MTGHAIETPGRARRELARRANGGIEVALYWNVRDNSTTVEVVQRRAGLTLAFPVEPEQALDAFYHPFAHVPAAPERATPGFAS